MGVNYRYPPIDLRNTRYRLLRYYYGPFYIYAVPTYFVPLLY